jgi:hypothetical protein
MTADLYHLSGLRGPSLAAFRAAGQIIAQHMAHDAEDVLASMRAHLAAAAQEPTYERGQAQVAMAANKLAIAVKLGERA